MTYFRACGHYHRPRELNDRVRNGNECDLAGVVTGKSAGRRCPTSEPLIVPCGIVGPRRLARRARHSRFEAVDPEGQESTWPSLPPLVPVSSDGYPPYTPGLSTGGLPAGFGAYAPRDLILRKVSRLDAFSAYPDRT